MLLFTMNANIKTRPAQGRRRDGGTLANKSLILALIAGVGVAVAQIPVFVTYYQPVPWQTDATPHIASCGPIADAKPWPGERLVALSRDLFYYADGRKKCGLHVKVLLENGVMIHGYVWDTMNARFKARVDVLYPKGEAPAWGAAWGKLFLGLPERRIKW